MAKKSAGVTASSTNIKLNAAAVKNSGALSWLDGDVPVIFFDFESFGKNPKVLKEGEDKGKGLHDVQNPYELGISIRYKGQTLHKAFRFTPPNLAGSLGLPPKGAHARKEWIKQHSRYFSDPDPENPGYRGDTMTPIIQKMVDKYGMTEAEGATPVPWKDINAFLEKAGIKPGEGLQPHFATHNGHNFDYPMMEAFLGTGDSGHFGKLFREAPQERRQDTAYTMAQLWGHTGRKVINAISKKGTEIYRNPAMWNPHGANKGFTGTGMEHFRETLKNAYSDTNSLPIFERFRDPDERNKLYEEFELTELILEPHGDLKAAFSTFMDKAGHSGVGDTALAFLALMPMLARDIKMYTSDHADLANEVTKQYQDNSFFVDKAGQPYYPANFHKAVDETRFDITPDDHFNQIWSTDYEGRGDERKATKVWRPSSFKRDASKPVQGTLEDMPKRTPKGSQASKPKPSDSLSEKPSEDKDAPTLDMFDEDAASITLDPDNKDDMSFADAYFAEHGYSRNPQADATKEFELEEDDEDDEWTPDPIAVSKRNSVALNNESFPEEIQSLIGENQIDVFKWDGGDHDPDPTGGRLMVVIPIGNSRIAFRSTMNDLEGNRTSDITGFVPVLGIGTMDDENSPTGVKREGVDDYLYQLFGSGPLGKMGALITSTLSDPDILQGLKDTVGGETNQPNLDTIETNRRINTPASLWLNKSVANPITRQDIMSESSSAYRKAAKKEFSRFTNGDLSLGELVGPISTLLSDPLRGVDAFEGLEIFDHETGKVDEEWMQKPEQMQKFMIAFREAGLDTVPTNKTPVEDFSYDDEKPQTVDVNFAKLFDSYFAGEMPDGIHPKQLINDGEGEDVSLLDQLTQYVVLRHRVDNLGESPIDVINTMGYDAPMVPDDYSPIPDLAELQETLEDSNADLVQKKKASQKYAAVADASTAPESVQDSIEDEEFKTSQAKFSLGTWFDNLKNAGPQMEDVEYGNKLSEFTELYGSPFTSHNQISSSLQNFKDINNIDDLFPDREIGQTNEDVHALVEGALEEYAGDPTSLLRELEWIRDNHPEWIDQESMQEALKNEDHTSPVGKWVDAVKHASDKGADFAYVEQEKQLMAEKFMTNSHREYIRQNAHEQVETVKNAPFKMPTGKKPKSLGEKAAAMATGAWKGSGYYNIWNIARNSQKLSQGAKALAAARRGDLGAVADLGITSQEQFMEHIGDLPVEGDAQRGLLGTLLQGKKTFRDLAREMSQEKDQKVNVADTLRGLQQLEHDRIQSRVPDAEITDADRTASQKAAKLRIELQDAWRAKLREHGTDKGGVDTAAKSATRNVKYGSPTTPSTSSATLPSEFSADVNVDTTVKKSLDKLKEYLDSV